VLTLIALTFGAAVFHYGTYDATMSHAYSFCLVALVVRLTLWVWERPTLGGSCALGAALGLVGLVRLTNLTILAFCLLVGVERPSDLGERGRSLFRHRRLAAAGAGIFLLTVMWQFAYWYRITGSVVTDPYRGRGEHLDLLHPHLLEVLFSVRKGLFVWTPLLVLATIGLPLLRRTARPLFVASVVSLGVATWVVSSWSIWWYGGSFGMRALVDVMPVWILGLAALVETARGGRLRRVVLAAAALTTAVAVHGMVAYWLKVIPYDKTTPRQYLESFRHW
jgi:hypothetical protein